MPEPRSAFDSWRALVGSATLDGASLRLLPLLYVRFRDDPPEPVLHELATHVYLANWNQNKSRYALTAEIVASLGKQGIDCLLLKGMAITSRYYRDSGLRAMGDVDFLVHQADVEPAMITLRSSGWIAEDGLDIAGLTRRNRVRHACQFTRGEDESCDLHWNPVVRCFSPVVRDLFWRDAEAIDLAGRPALIPCATDQLFHACAHGLQWSWEPQIRWIADALTILQSKIEIDWDRLRWLARSANMNVRIEQALEYLRRVFDAPVPAAVIASYVQQHVPAWEEQEYEVLQKVCPLGPLDSARWHAALFWRIRRHDPQWSKQNLLSGFLDYLAVFLNLKNRRELSHELWKQWRAR